MSKRSANHGTFVIERAYPAPPERVYAAWAIPSAKRQWFGPPDGGGEHELDFRLGGPSTSGSRSATRRTRSTPSTKTSSPTSGSSTPPTCTGRHRMSVSVSTVEFLATGEGTQLRYTEQGVYLDGIDTPSSASTGPPRCSTSSARRSPTGPVYERIRTRRREPRGGTEASVRQRRLALYVLCIGMLMIVLDVTIVNVALPAIQEDLHFSSSSLAWVVNAYLIAFGGLLLLAGRVGDLLGRRRVFLAGVALFTCASLLCGLAQSSSWLVTARFVQGIGGAMTSAVILGMIVTMFPEPGSRRRRSACSRSWPRRAGRSAWSPGACSPSRSTGTGSSSSTCRSAWRRSSRPGGWFRTCPGSACGPGPTCPELC